MKLRKVYYRSSLYLHLCCLEETPILQIQLGVKRLPRRQGNKKVVLFAFASNGLEQSMAYYNRN